MKKRKTALILRLLLAWFWGAHVAVPLTARATDPPQDAVDTSPEVTTEDAKATVLAALRAMTTKAFRMSMYLDTSTLQSQPGVSRMSVTEFVPPNRIRTRTTTSSGGQSETIRVGEKAYSKQADGTWKVSQPLLPQQTVAQMMENTLRDIEKGVSAVTFLGGEEVNGEPATVYRVLSTTKVDGTETHGTNTLWVRKADGLLVKQASEVMPQAKPGAPQVTMRSVQTYEYDPTITVEAPPGPPATGQDAGAK